MTKRDQPDDANLGRCPWQVPSWVVVVWRTHRGGPVPRVYTEERSDETLGDLELVCNEAVQSRGRGRGIHVMCVFFLSVWRYCCTRPSRYEIMNERAVRRIMIFKQPSLQGASFTATHSVKKMVY